MTDQELRDRMLQKLYDQRHNDNQGRARLPAGLNMPDCREQVLANILGQLRDKGLAKWDRVAGGLCRGAARITAAGVEEIENINKVVIPPIEIGSTMAAHPVHTLVAWFTFVLGLALIAAGIALVALGAKGATAFHFFGNDFSSENVGVVALALGFLLCALNFRRLLKSVERLKG